MSELYEISLFRTRPFSLGYFCAPPYYPCERVELRDSFKIGDVWSGIDANKVSNMINYMSDVTECGNCVGKHLCSICPALISEKEPNCYNDVRIQEHCRGIHGDLSSKLQQYISLLETHPHIFQDNAPDITELEWISNIYFLHGNQS